VRGHRDLQIASASSLVCVLVALLVPLETVRLVFAAPLALLLPGYAITTACFARRRLERPQLMVLSLALSLATLALGGLALNYVPGGIRALSWAVLLLLVVLNGCRVAALRRPPRAEPPMFPRPRLGGAGSALLLAGLSAAVAAVALSFATLPAKNAIGYTQLWALPEPGSKGTEIQVGVGSEEQDQASYYLLVRVGDRPLVRRDIHLGPGEAQVIRLRPELPATGGPVPVIATLLRQNSPTRVYRRVKNWLSAPAPSAPR
jgi:hypothetical protein